MELKKYVIDIETHDPYLQDYGAGAIRGDGRLLGVGLYDGMTPEYITPSNTKDMARVRAILADPDAVKIMHNGIYDLDWLMHYCGFVVNGRCEDTMTREYLLNAYAKSYSLDASSKRHGLEGKNAGETIDQWWSNHGGKGKAIENLQNIPEEIVGRYCMQDIITTWDLYHAQQPLLEQEGLIEANDVEVELYPLIMQMKKNGVRIDWDKRCEISDSMRLELDSSMSEIQRKYPFFESLTAPTQLRQIWEAEGIPMSFTDTGRPSFNAEVLEQCTHPIGMKIKELRSIDTALSKFVDGSLADYYIDGYIHPTFFPALRDEGGTITGRFSCRNPNLQNMPARGDKFGSLIRSSIIPEEGCSLGAWDYKQIEYVVFTHYSIGPGSDEARQKIIDGVDYHQMTMDMMGWDGKEGRHIAKNLNFGSIYGMGWRSFAQKFRANIIGQATAAGMSCEAFAKAKMDEYYTKVSFVKPTVRGIEETVKRRGYVKTLSGRRQRMPLDGGAYKIVNYLVQGSASDILKAGLVAGWKAGVFNVLTLHGTIHDENLFSIPHTKEGIQAAEEFARIMANQFELKVPIRVDMEAGPNWGNCSSEYWLDIQKKYGGK